MERHEIIELLGQLKLAGMRAAYDEVVAAGVRAQHPVQRILGELLRAQLARPPRGLRTAPGDAICRAIGVTLPPVFQEMPVAP